jgi:hypothetical protein
LKGLEGSQISITAAGPLPGSSLQTTPSSFASNYGTFLNGGSSTGFVPPHQSVICENGHAVTQFVRDNEITQHGLNRQCIMATQLTPVNSIMQPSWVNGSNDPDVLSYQAHFPPDGHHTYAPNTSWYALGCGDMNIRAPQPGPVANLTHVSAHGTVSQPSHYSVVPTHPSGNGTVHSGTPAYSSVHTYS